MSIENKYINKNEQRNSSRILCKISKIKIIFNNTYTILNLIALYQHILLLQYRSKLFVIIKL